MHWKFNSIRNWNTLNFIYQHDINTSSDKHASRQIRLDVTLCVFNRTNVFNLNQNSAHVRHQLVEQKRFLEISYRLRKSLKHNAVTLAVEKNIPVRASLREALLSLPLKGKQEKAFLPSAGWYGYTYANRLWKSVASLIWANQKKASYTKALNDGKQGGRQEWKKPRTTFQHSSCASKIFSFYTCHHLTTHAYYYCPHRLSGPCRPLVSPPVWTEWIKVLLVCEMISIWSN